MAESFSSRASLSRSLESDNPQSRTVRLRRNRPVSLKVSSQRLMAIKRPSGGRGSYKKYVIQLYRSCRVSEAYNLVNR